MAGKGRTRIPLVSPPGRCLACGKRLKRGLICRACERELHAGVKRRMEEGETNGVDER